MPELPHGDGPIHTGDGFPGDGDLGQDLAADATSADLDMSPDLSPTADLSPPPDQRVPDSKPVGKIQVTTPKGGEKWTAGSKRIITWIASASIKWLNIDLYKGGLKDSSIALSVANTGKWTWTVPGTVAHGTQYRVRIADAQNSSVSALSPAPFTITSWQYRRTVTVDSGKATSALGNYPVMLELSSGNFTYANARSDGADLRFSTSTTPGKFDLSYWIEKWNPGGSSKVWVTIPSLAANSVRTVYLYYGNNTAKTTSSLSKTFTKSFSSSGNLSLSGAQKYDSFLLNAGHTLTIGQGQALTITARRIVINGNINGNGRGYSGGSSTNNGQGQGGGGSATDCGGGGGGFGGQGGKGGHDSSDTPGSPGKQYGSSSMTTINMGSGGGGGGVSSGGNGGGAVALIARDISTVGDIRVNGVAGGGSSQSGGGGSGGGVLIKGYSVKVKSLITAQGGAGGSGSGQANDGGGGGGGGRIKLFYEDSLNQSGVWLLNGGVGGKYGDASHGKPGSNGTSYKGKTTVEVVGVKVGAEQKL